MNIRTATLDDAKALAEVSSDTYRTTYAGMFSKDSWLDFATPDYFRPIWEKDLTPATSEGPVLLAEQDGKVIGFIAAKSKGERGDMYGEKPADTFVELKELYVLNGHQFSKQKVGTHLLFELVKDLADGKIVVGHAARANAKVRKYMSSLGAKEVESGTIVLFRHKSNGDEWKVETGRVSFYWKVPALRDALVGKLA